MTKEEGQSLFQFAGYSPSLREVGIEAGAMKGSFLLACSPGFLIYLSYIAQAHLPRHGITHSRLGLPVSISNQENASQMCLLAYLTGNSSVEILSSGLYLVCIKLSASNHLGYSKALLKDRLEGSYRWEGPQLMMS